MVINFGQQPLVVMLGVWGKAAAYSLTDAPITMNGSTVTPSAVGTDQGAGIPAAMYVANFDVSGSYVCEQSGNRVTGNPPAQPAAGEDYSLMVITCDNAGTTRTNKTGMYGYIKDYAENGKYPLAGIIHTDDVCYAHSELDDSAFTGHVSTGNPTTTDKEYDYALIWAGLVGLLGDRTLTRNSHGHSADRQWCYRNLPRLFQWGDHEVDNNAGWDNNTKSRTYWPAAYGVWDALVGGMMPPLLADTADHSEGQHYGISLGDLYICAPDRTTMGEGGRDTGTVLFGNTQIDEVIAAMNGAEPFKLLSMCVSLRYLVDAAGLAAVVAVNDISYAANEAIGDARVVEYARLMTAANAIQANQIASGHKFCTIHGDHHNPLVVRHENTDGVVNESFMQFNTGTVNGSGNHGLDASLVVGLDTGRGQTLEYLDHTRVSSGAQWSCIRVDVLGSESPKKMRVSLIDGAHRTVYSCEYNEDAVSNIPTSVREKHI